MPATSTLGNFELRAEIRQLEFNFRSRAEAGPPSLSECSAGVSAAAFAVAVAVSECSAAGPASHLEGWPPPEDRQTRLTIPTAGSRLLLRMLTAMRLYMSAKWFGAALLLLFVGVALGWPATTAAQSSDSLFRGLQPAVSILTPTNGVDFNSYLNRLLATMKRNWFAVMPESAMMGEKGIVVLTFHIQRDGKIPDAAPTLERTSGSKEFEDAAMKAVQISAPFAPLPDAFHDPNIEVRFIFFYNAAVPKGTRRPRDCENNFSSE
jgi:TonB family protein